MNALFGFAPLASVWAMVQKLIQNGVQEPVQPPPNHEPPEPKSPYRRAAAAQERRTVYEEVWTWSGDSEGRQRTFQEMLGNTWDLKRLREQWGQYEDELRDLQEALQQEPEQSADRPRFLAAIEAVQYNLVQTSLPLRTQIWIPRNLNDLTKKAEARQLLSRTNYEAILSEARLRKK